MNKNATWGTRRPGAGRTWSLCVALLAIGVIARPAIAAPDLPEIGRDGANFAGETPSADTREVADWVVRSGDNRRLPFLIVDKHNARVFAFDGKGKMRGTAPALLGVGRGDGTVPGIGKRKLTTMRTDERTTPAGRFEASLGHDFDQDILWVDYEAALSLHRVVVGSPIERRAQRLSSASVLDNRISYGCINVPAAFYDQVVAPAFRGTVGIVYILPETKPISAYFPVAQGRTPANAGKDAQ